MYKDDPEVTLGSTAASMCMPSAPEGTSVTTVMGEADHALHHDLHN